MQRVSGRAVQLDGLRAIAMMAMMAICWDHWCPAGWPRVFLTEEPFLIRETARKFQWTTALVTVWRRN